MSLLCVRDLRVEFDTRDGLVRALNGVTFEVDKGLVLALLGESGSGKSVTLRSIPSTRSATRSARRSSATAASVPPTRAGEPAS